MQIWLRIQFAVVMTATVLMTAFSVASISIGVDQLREDADAMAHLREAWRETRRAQVAELAGELGPNVPAAIDRTHAALVGLTERFSEERPAFSSALRSLEAARRTGDTGAVIKALAVADDALDEVSSKRIAGSLVGVRMFLIVGGALWLVAVAGYLVTGQRARRASLRERGASKRDLDQGVAALRGALEGCEPVAAARLPEVLAPLAPASEELVAEVVRLGHKLRVEQRRDGLMRDTMRAMELADDEHEVWELVERAVADLAPDAQVQVWAADNSMAELHAARPDGPRICNPDAPGRCPVTRRSSTEHFKPAPSICRCPRLEAGAGPVTCTPLAVGGRAVGALQVVGSSFEESDEEALRQIAATTGNRLTILRTLGERELQASTDVLTGLANRRRMNRTLSEWDGEGADYAVLSLDLDHFKRLNDTYGHDQGDRCLKVFAQVLRDCTRPGDLCCRPGGEEFTVLLPGVTCEDAERVARRIQQRLAMASRQQAGVAFTCSMGLAARPSHGDNSAAVLKAADVALYAAKEAGRDRWAVAGTGGEAPAITALGPPQLTPPPTAGRPDGGEAQAGEAPVRRSAARSA